MISDFVQYTNRRVPSENWEVMLHIFQTKQHFLQSVVAHIEE
jgi:hypothetical protein